MSARLLTAAPYCSRKQRGGRIHRRVRGGRCTQPIQLSAHAPADRGGSVGVHRGECLSAHLAELDPNTCEEQGTQSGVGWRPPLPCRPSRALGRHALRAASTATKEAMNRSMKRILKAVDTMRVRNNNKTSLFTPPPVPRHPIGLGK